jgi:dihydroxyacetone kinase-like protein
LRLSVETWKVMLESASSALRANRALLSKLDAAVGDGDHGETMVRIADKMDDTRLSFQGYSIPALFETLGDDLMGVPGGSSTTLYGAFFGGLAQESAEVLAMFSGALAALQEVSGARRGDKTMLDALIPFLEALRANPDDPEGLVKAAEAARRGAEETANFIAKFGRAKNYRERTLGHKDPGAVSMSIILTSLAETAKRSEEIL